MRRRHLLSLALFLSACSKPARTFDQILPLEVTGGWRRGELRKPAQTPPLIADAHPEDAAEASYSGTGTIVARAYRMKSETSAFELMQKWRHADGLAAYRGLYFFVVKADGVSPAAVMAFLAELQRINAVA